MATRRDIDERLTMAVTKAAEAAMDEQRSRIVSRTRVGLDADYKSMAPLIDPKPSGSRPLVAGMEFFGQARVSASSGGAGATLEIEGRDADLVRWQEHWGRTLFSMTDRDREYIVADFREALKDELRRK